MLVETHIFRAIRVRMLLCNIQPMIISLILDEIASVFVPGAGHLSKLCKFIEIRIKELLVGSSKVKN